ncbi:SBBP repeat-containing protein [Flavobacterium sp.]|uniref:SBBP repeat-containing protein n=1 Tax=Flavobacterium sp. TaxID=239 RepID=UPI00120589AB|nr:SBBP repeat-containing protein [Flavobacterium sp.]RZJ73962.1 MAG: T9SS type A sorting domain-containing protein [Flavobacterium sp.]
MTKKLLFLFLLFPIVALAQIPNWQWAKNAALMFNGMTAIHDIGPDGNIVMVGDFNQPTVTFGSTTLSQTTPNFSDVYMVKYDQSGNVVWAKSFGGTNTDSVSGVRIAPDGSIYVTGGFWNNLTIDGTTFTTVLGANYISKYDSQGNLLWLKRATNSQSGWGIQQMDFDSQGNLYVAGSINIPTLTFNSQTVNYVGYQPNSVNRVFFGKFDQDGNCLWLRCPETTQVNEWGSFSFGISVDNQGNMAVTGRFHEFTLDFGGITLSKTSTDNYNSNVFIAQYDTNGSLLWARNAGTSTNNITTGSGIAHDNSGNLFVTGNFTGTISLDGISLTSGGGSKQFLFKFSAVGTALWGKAVHATGACSALSRSLDVDSFGSVYVAGMTQCSSLEFWDGVSITMQGQGGLYIVKFNADGLPIWVRRSGEQNINNEACIKVLAPNEIYVSGTFSASTFTLGTITLTKSPANYDLYLAKMYAQPLSVDDFASQKIAVYPNPVTSEMFLENVASGLDFSISDVSGRMVRTGKTELSPISVIGLASGIYVLNLRNQSENKSVKFIKQ